MVFISMNCGASDGTYVAPADAEARMVRSASFGAGAVLAFAAGSLVLASPRVWAASPSALVRGQSSVLTRTSRPIAASPADAPISPSEIAQAAPPGAFGKVSPQDAFPITNPNPVLSWNVSSGATGYEYCIDTTDDYVCSGWIDLGNVLSVALSGLTFNNTYYWQVRAYNADGATYADSTIVFNRFFRFILVPPTGPFNKTAPSNGATVLGTTLTLTWAESASPASYFMCYDAADDGACSYPWSRTSLSSADLAHLNANTTYFWQVRAIGSTLVYADDGAWWHFTTGAFRWPLFWQHDDGRVAAWLVNGTTVEDARPVGPGSLADPDWRIVASGDFDADGGRDLVFQHQRDGRLAAWLMNDTVLRESRPLSPPQVADVSWKVRASADMDGDGWPDLIWQNEISGHVGIWFMTSTWLREAQLTTPDSVSDLNWGIVGAGDMNGDGHADVVWRDQATGKLAVWLMNGSRMTAGVYLAQYIEDMNWQLQAVSDANGDLQPDLLWQNTSTGELWVWLTHHDEDRLYLVRTGERFSVPRIFDNQWRIVGPK
jgi:hypothetical protein